MNPTENAETSYFMTDQLKVPNRSAIIFIITYNNVFHTGIASSTTVA